MSRCVPQNPPPPPFLLKITWSALGGLIPRRDERRPKSAAEQNLSWSIPASPRPWQEGRGTSASDCWEFHEESLGISNYREYVEAALCN